MTNENNYYAMARLGEMYREGRGIKQNLQKSEYLLTTAYNNGETWIKLL